MQFPQISIITPVYNMLPYLNHCINSVNDQEVELEHLIIDGGSDDGTKQLLERTDNLKWVSEKDNGMYDALNKGLKMAQGEIIGHLNADEQYLPETLPFIVKYFEEHPEVDYVVGNFLVTDKEGKLIAYRKSFQPYWPFFFSNYLYTFTCTLFYRKKVANKIQYDCGFRSIADVDFFYKLQQYKFKGVHLDRFMSTFVHSGQNLSVLPISRTEKHAYSKNRLPSWFKYAKPFLKMFFFSARIVFKTFWHKGAISYRIYTNANTNVRTTFRIDKPSWKWL